MNDLLRWTGKVRTAVYPFSFANTSSAYRGSSGWLATEREPERDSAQGLGPQPDTYPKSCPGCPYFSRKLSVGKG